ncbi:MAG TPA: hypothetical protein P5056_01095 [Candidatus Paceibacterota bacterium]|nr:hypothetical protein [Candidatus Paceibacterota bacterium]
MHNLELAGAMEFAEAEANAVVNAELGGSDDIEAKKWRHLDAYTNALQGYLGSIE